MDHSEGGSSVAYGLASENNAQPKSVTVAAGDGSVSATTAMGYDAVGNVTSIDGPLPGTGDTSYFVYDLARRQTGTIAVDPDGAGSARPTATRFTFDTFGRPSVKEVGTVPSQATDLGSFQAAQSSTTSYDSSGRAVRAVAAAGGTTYGVTEWSYDELGRPLCTTVRMNAGAWGTATDACTAEAASSDGPDRITRVTSYDALDRATAITSAYGTANAATEQTSYTQNGQTQSVTDGKGNVTSYTYDGFDRVYSITYPSPSTAGQTNANDWEGFAYNADGTINQHRLRDGQVYVNSYDALGRLTLLQRYKLNVGVFDQTSYGYDLLGHMTSAAQQSSGETVTRSYDALGRVVSDAQPAGTMVHGYDAAGRRTRLTWPGGAFVTYEYNLNGTMSVIRDSGGAAIATYSYNSLGQRTGVVRGNGTQTSYGYDPMGRLTSMTQDLAGTAADQAIGLGYNAAGQIKSRTSSNDAYAWGGAVSANRPYVANGLNQYTSAGSTAFQYDARGNLTGSGSDTYTYNMDNQLTATSAGQTFGYDPLGRLDRMLIGGRPTTLLRDLDGALIGRRINGNPTPEGFVPGPGGDEPVMWIYPLYSLAPLYFHADERGSVIALSDKTGALNGGANRYDEHGIPNVADGGDLYGMFGYTGQVSLGGGLYDYKARVYSSTLGRFMQTDPIGYGDGKNWYAYAHGDAVNGSDPSGTTCTFNSQPTQEQINQCSAEETKRWANYHPGPSFDSAYMAGMADSLAMNAQAQSNLYGATVVVYDGESASLSLTPGQGLGHWENTGRPTTESDGYINVNVHQTWVPYNFAGSGIAANAVAVPVPQYPIPIGYGFDPMDPSQRYVLDRRGHRVINPRYKQAIDKFRPNKCGIARDAAAIVVGSAAGGAASAESAAGKIVGAALGALGAGSQVDFCD